MLLFDAVIENDFTCAEASMHAFSALPREIDQGLCGQPRHLIN